jgi:hypothetical protein
VTKLWLAVPVAIGAFAWILFARQAARPPQPAAVGIASFSPDPGAPPPARRNYRYSLVPYGVQFPASLKQAIAGDEDIADHFRDFDFSKARFIVLVKDTCAYVSFRKESRIRWTTQCVILHKGELILTDGRVLVRARCGNRISYIPRVPVEPIPIDDLERTDLPPTDYPAVSRAFAFGNVPPVPPSGPGEAPPTEATNRPPTIPGSPVGPVAPAGGGLCCASNPAPPVAVPEADSESMLLLCGLLLAGSTYRRPRR